MKTEVWQLGSLEDYESRINKISPILTYFNPFQPFNYSTFQLILIASLRPVLINIKHICFICYIYTMGGYYNYINHFLFLYFLLHTNLLPDDLAVIRRLFSCFIISNQARICTFSSGGRVRSAISSGSPAWCSLGKSQFAGYITGLLTSSSES